jgi:hypothetical protein
MIRTAIDNFIILNLLLVNLDVLQPALSSLHPIYLWANYLTNRQRSEH